MDLVLSETDCLRFEDQSIYRGAFQQFAKIRNQGKFCDVTLKTDKGQFSAHKIVLSAVIPYFHGMFMNNMVESDEKVIQLHGLDNSALESLINYAYTGDIFITLTNVQSIFMVANFLQVISVKDACSDFMQKRISNQSVLALRSFARNLYCKDLLEASDEYLYNNFSQITRTEDFYELNFDDLLEIISHDELKVPNEEAIFEAVLNWTEYNTQERRQYLPKLMVQVRFPQISRQYLLDRVSNNQMIHSSLNCRNVLDATKDFLILPEHIKNLDAHNFRPRHLQNSLYGLIFVIGSSTQYQIPQQITASASPQLTMEIYHPILRQWLSLDHHSVEYRTRVGIAVLNNSIYLIGGFDGTRRLTTVEMFNTQTQKWSRVNSMNCNRSALGAATLHNKIYVCGGYDGAIALKSCEEYCPSTKRWRIIPPMLECRSATGLVQLNDKLYAVGGHNGLAIDSSVECYDPTWKSWNFVKSMLTRRCRHGVATVNQHIYAAGGYDGVNFLSSVEMYSSLTDQWTFVTSMRIPRSRISLVSTFGELFAIGGYDGNMDLDSVECYDVNLAKWIEVTKLDSHLGGVGCGIAAFSDICPELLALFRK